MVSGVCYVASVSRYLSRCAWLIPWFPVSKCLLHYSAAGRVPTGGLRVPSGSLCLSEIVSCSDRLYSSIEQTYASRSRRPLIFPKAVTIFSSLSQRSSNTAATIAPTVKARTFSDGIALPCRTLVMIRVVKPRWSHAAARDFLLLIQLDFV